MEVKLRSWMIALIAMAILGSTVVLADGDEILGTPSIPIASGSGIVTSGVGLVEDVGVLKPGDIMFNVPGDVVQAILYWSGRNRFADAPLDTTLIVNGGMVTGPRIGYSLFENTNGDQIAAYRQDITGLVTPGVNVLSITGTLFANFFTSGAGVVVIFDDGSASAIDIRDGLDTAYAPSVFADEQVTVPQTFSFAPASSDRIANLSLFVTEVGDFFNSGRFRTSTVRITLSDATQIDFVNELQSVDGALWDNFERALQIPAGVDSLTVEIISDGDDPASAMWLTAALSVEEEEDGGDGCTPGYWKNHLDKWGPTGLAPGDSLNSSFGCVLYNPDITLEQAINLNGGGIKKVARHGTAALLNALHPAVDYPFTTAEVIAAVCSGDVDAQATANELSSTCPAEDF